MTVTMILEDAAFMARHKHLNQVAYENYKRKIARLGLDPDKYQWAVKELAERMGL